MDPYRNNESHPHQLYFSVDGLPLKEQSLFKSFIRLLDHRTRHQWICGTETAQLRVVSDEAAPHVRNGDCAVLVLGGNTNLPGHHLSLPIHADELQRELDLIGDLLTMRRSSNSHSNLLIQPEELVHLTRWPTPELLTSRDHLRLATLMTGRPLSLDDVQQRSGVARETCLEFMSTLAQSGMLIRESARDARPAPAATPTAPAAAVQGGLLARIRSRLGLTKGAQT